MGPRRTRVNPPPSVLGGVLHSTESPASHTVRHDGAQQRDSWSSHLNGLPWADAGERNLAAMHAFADNTAPAEARDELHGIIDGAST